MSVPPEYAIDLRDTVQPDEETYERFFTGRDGTAHLIFATRGTERRVVFREMFP